MPIFTIYDYIMKATLQFKREEKNISTANDPRISCEGPSTAHRLGFSGKKRKAGQL